MNASWLKISIALALLFRTARTLPSPLRGSRQRAASPPSHPAFCLRQNAGGRKTKRASEKSEARVCYLSFEVSILLSARLSLYSATISS